MTRITGSQAALEVPWRYLTGPLVSSGTPPLERQTRRSRPDQAVQLMARLVAALGEVLPLVEQVDLLGR